MDGARTNLHTRGMTNHFAVGTWYRVVQFEDGTFGVEVTKPSCRPLFLGLVSFLPHYEPSSSME
jgi:hypothetical protein